MKRIVRFRQIEGKEGPYLLFILKGEHGAVIFQTMTFWKSLKKESIGLMYLMAPQSKIQGPIPFDLGYHSKVPLYDGQSRTDKHCVYCDNGPCYYEGSTLASENIFRRLIEHGDEAVWYDLEEYYKQTFGELE